MEFTELFKSIQQSALSSLWSQGVTLSRGENTFALDASSEELIIRLKIKNQPISHRIRLWLNELDWDCDCSCPESPCPHVIASIILLKRGELKPAETAVTADSAHIEYCLLRSPQGLCFERWICAGPKREKKLETSLISYLSGLESGRTRGPSVLATQVDYSIDESLKTYRSGNPLERTQLEALFGHYQSDLIFFLDQNPVKLSTQRITVRAECVDEGEGYRTRKIKNQSVTESFPQGVALCADTLKLIAPTRLTADEARWISGEGMYWPPEKEKSLSAEIIPALEKKIPVEIFSLKLPQMIELEPRIDLQLEKESTPQGEICLSVLANIVYGNPPFAQLNYSNLELSPVKGSSPLNKAIRRNQNFERQLISKLSSELNLQPGRRIQLRGLSAVDFTFKIKSWDFEGNGFEVFNPSEKNLRPHFDVKSLVDVKDGMKVDMQFETSNGATASFLNVFKAWQEGAEYMPLIDGSWAPVPQDWMKRFGKRIQEFLAARDAAKEIPAYKIPEFTQLCDEMQETYPDSLKNLRDLLEGFDGIPEVSLPVDLGTELRGYQKKGVNWLCFLRSSKLGAMLADDMGLGKTLQTLCALEGRSLVVAPTSVIFNWAQEIKKFRPGLKASLYYGPTRKMDDSADVVLTSYGILRMDLAEFKKENWGTIVLDEAQTIKNPDSQVARAAHELRGNFKVSLSGTPIENRLDDLWSQFQFLNPGLLGKREDFLENFARPIARGEDQVAKRLRQKIKPFILRRLKREVAPELPARTESVLHCELSADERNVYDSLLATTRKEVIANLEGGGSVIKALEVILRLRQACCHQALVPGQEAPHSSKLNLLMDTLEESLAEGHKSLIFSQWTSFLDLIGAEMQKRDFRYSRIDGSTLKRQEIVNEFQGSAGPPVMLISLKAGGTGLTLTAADHVFIMDPWWNPAVENQAADRAHRIGQENPVMIHRLVARETIEERILLLQEKKKDLALSVLSEGASAVTLSRQDLLDLLD